MDPNACIDRINMALADHDWGEMTEACEDLITWIEEGGYPPNHQIDQDLAAELEMEDEGNDTKAAAYEALATLLELFS